MKVIGPIRLGYLWDQIKFYIASRKYAGGAADGGTANKAASIPFGEVDSTSTANAFTATVDGITELRSGVCCYLRNDVVTSAAASTAPKCWTLNINNLGEKPVYVTTAAATYSTTHFTKNYKMLFTYDESLDSGNGGWYIGVLFNTNTTYSDMTQAEITAGTGTTGRKITPKMLRDNFYTEDEVDTLLNSKVNNYSLEMEIGVSGNNYSVESIAYNNTYVTTFSAIYNICVSGNTSIVIKGYIDDGTDTNYYFYYVGSNMLGSGDVYFVSSQEEGYFVLHLYSEGSDVLYSSIDYVEYAQGGSGDVNVIEGITMNGSAVTPDANKVVNLGTVITAHQDISGKQDVISDLAAIRSGAALGATALQSFTESDPTVPAWAKASNKPSYTAAEVGALPDSTIIPTKVSDLTNDSGFTSNTGTITGITMNGASKGTSGVINLGTVLTEHQDISSKANSADLATVATSGSYNDLSNKPTIPAAQVNSDWNASSGVAQILNKPTIPTVPTALSAFTDDLGSSPTHTHSQYLTSAPVTSVNGQTGAVSLTIPTVPTNVSAFTNDAGYTTNTGTVTSTGGTTAVNNIQVVSALPASPDANTLYLIPES